MALPLAPDHPAGEGEATAARRVGNAGCDRQIQDSGGTGCVSDQGRQSRLSARSGNFGEDVAVVPIVAAMVQIDLHKLFTTPAARNAFLGSLLGECKRHGYSGFQIDFENVNWTDRDLLSSLVAETATALHKETLELTIATVSNSPGVPGKSNYSHWLYANWRGAYDPKALAQSADLICLMTYDQNTRWTEPGPVAGYAWTAQKLEYALQFIPKEKFSLGPLYGYHWFAGDPGKEEKPNPTTEYIGQQDVDQYLAAYHPHLEWNFADRTAWFYFFYEKVIIPEILALHLTKVLNEPEDDSIRQLSRSRYYPGLQSRKGFRSSSPISVRSLDPFAYFVVRRFSSRPQKWHH